MINNFIEDISIIKSADNEQLFRNDNNLKNIEFSFDKSFELSDLSKIEKKEIIKKIKNKVDNANNKINFSLNPNFKVNNNNKNKRYKKNSNYNHIYLKSIQYSPIKKYKIKDLDNIPLPIFSCIYCSNEISFKHLSNNIISNKYLFQSSVYDLKQLNFLITYKYQFRENDKNNKLLNIFINNSEYLRNFYKNENIKKYFKSNTFKMKCSNNKIITDNAFKYNFLYNIIKIKKYTCFKKIKENFLFKRYNSLKKINYNHKYKIDFLNKDKNSQSKKYINKIKKNNFKILDNITLENNKNLKFLDLKRKINKNDIEWENIYYDVYNPIINDDLIDINDEKKFIKINTINKIHINKNDDDIKGSNYIHSENNVYKYFDNKRLYIISNSGSSQLLPINRSIVQSDIKPLMTPSHSTKNEIKIHNYNNLSPYQKIRLKNIHSKSEKNMHKNEKKKLTDLININGKVLFDYKVNVKKEILKDCFNLKICNDNYMNKRKNMNVNMNKNLGNMNNINFQFFNKINSHNIDFQNHKNNIINNEAWINENLKLKRKNYNPNNNIFNKPIFNNSINTTKQNEIKYNNYNSNLFKLLNNIEDSRFKNKIKNSSPEKKYILLANRNPFDNISLVNEKI